MEEKERYIILSDRQVKDTQNNSQGFMSINSICKTLNQQDKELSKLRASYQQVKEENQQLKQQLAEKEKEISNLNGLVRERDKQIKNLKTNKKRVIEHKNKTKISFALEQLEKVKEFFLEEHRDEEMDTDYIITKDAGEIADYILDQIKQLKEGK